MSWTYKVLPNGCAGVKDPEGWNAFVLPTEEDAKKITTAINCHDELLAACVAMDAIVESLWCAIDWGKPFNLDIAALNTTMLKCKATIAKAKET